MEIHERIRELRKMEKLSQTKFGEKLGVSKDVITNIEYGRVEPKQLLINYLCKTFNVNKKWLLTGEGEIYEISQEEDSLGKALADISLSENEDLKNIAKKLTQLNEDKLELINKLIDNLIEKK